MDHFTLASAANDSAIVIRQNNRIINGAGTALVLTVWAVAVHSFLTDLALNHVNGAPTILLCMVLALLLAFGVYSILLLVWIIFGAQVVSILDGDLMIERKCGSRQIGRRKIFAITHIHNMRIEERRDKYKGRTSVTYSIVCDYLGKRESLLMFLSKQRAESLLNGPLQTIVQSQAFTPPK